jgi:hypothetical protein
MKNDIGKLRVKFVLVEVPVHFLQVSQQRIFLEFEINSTLSEPRFG